MGTFFITVSIILLVITIAVLPTIFILGATHVQSSGWQHVHRRTLLVAILLFAGTMAACVSATAWMWRLFASTTAWSAGNFGLGFAGLLLAALTCVLAGNMINVAAKTVKKLSEETPSVTLAEVVDIARKRK